MNRVIDLTTINYDNATNRKIEYIVIHYVGAVSTAKNNGTYFKNTYRSASAHYFVDENDCVQVVEDKNISWHCGTMGAYKHFECRNTNSIGIEMCCKNNGNWYFEEATINNTIELVKELMQKYNIPVENVIRHYDVTGKICPEPYVRNEIDWNIFKSSLVNNVVDKELSEEEIVMIEQLRNEVQALRNEVAELKNIIKGNNAPVPQKKSVDEIAREVIKGVWGVGQDRKDRLTQAGYNPTEVQNRVNQLI